MRVLAVLVLAGCSRTVVDDFTVVTPVAHVRALAGKSTVQMHGTSCKSICSTRRDYEEINYCVIATLDVNPHLACRVRRSFRSASGEISVGDAFDVLVDVPTGVSIPTSGPVPKALCEQAGCTGKLFADDVSVIDECSVYTYHPDETEPFLVCSFRVEREINHLME